MACLTVHAWFGVHREADLVAHRLAHRADPGDVQRERLEPDADLEDAEALRHVRLRLGRGLVGRPVEEAFRARDALGPAAAEPAIERDARPSGGEVVERDVQDGLGGGVPGERPIELSDRPAPLAERAADDERREVVAEGGDDAGRALAGEVRHVAPDLAPAHLPVVGGEPDEDLLQRGHPAGEVAEARLERQPGREDLEPPDPHRAPAAPKSPRTDTARSTMAIRITVHRMISEQIAMSHGYIGWSQRL